MIHGFERFKDAIRALPDKDRLEKDDLLIDRYRIFADGQFEGFYAPFDYVNHDARLVLVGVTPGWLQMERAFSAAHRGLNHGLDDLEVLRSVKRAGSFAGPMRKLLVQMLDGIGLHDHLGLVSCSELFDAAFDLLHCTSAVSAPTFVKGGENYTGHAPPLVSHPLLRRYILENLGAELMSISRALIVPLGAAASSAVNLVIEQCRLAPDRCLLGSPILREPTDGGLGFMKRIGS